jgi:NADH:ubiquinone oxidoreductase subunit 4 (subunit M)
MNERRRGLDLGALMFGALLLFAGAYYLLRNTLGMDIPDIDWDMVWPIVVIAIGVAVLYGAWTKAGRGSGTPS